MDFDNQTDTITPDVASNTITFGGNGSILIPSGTTSNRPGSSLTAGMLRWASDATSGGVTGSVEVYTGATATWKSFQYQSANLDSLSAMSTSGFINRNGTTYTARSLAAPAAGFTITNNDGTAGNPTFALANDLAGVEGLSTTGIVVRTGDGTWTTRTLVAGTNISFTNANGVSGDITINASGVGGGSSIAITDEGSSLTTAASSINFTGPGVTATSSSNAVTVTIPGIAPTTTAASKAGQFTLRTTAGTQSVTGLGFTPVAVIVYFSSSFNNGTAQELQRCYGAATSATKRWVTTFTVCPTNSWSGQQFVPDRFLKLRSAVNDAVVVEADFLTMDYDGFSFSVTTTDSTTRVFNYIAIGGDGVVASAGWWTLAGSAMSGTAVSGAASVGGTQSISGLGFTPKITMFGWANAFNGGSTWNGYNHFNYGWAMSTAKQFCITEFLDSDSTPIQAHASSRYGTACHQWVSNSGTNDRASFSSNDATGFTVSWPAATGTFDYYIGYLSIGGAISVDVANITEPGSTGNSSTTGLSFTPNLGIFASMGNATADWTDATVATDAHFGLGATTGTSSRWSLAYYFDSASGSSTIPYSTSTSKTLLLSSSTTATTVAEADLVSFDASGYTLNWSKVDGVGSKVFVVTMGANTTTRGLAGGTSGTIQYNDGSAGLAGATKLTVTAQGNFAVAESASEPTAPSDGSVLYVMGPAGRDMPKWMNAAGRGNHVQSFGGYSRVAMIAPGGGTASTAPFGTNIYITTFGTVGIFSSFANTNFRSTFRRNTFSTTATANTPAGVRSSYAEFWRGNAAGLGGYFIVARFGIETLGATQRSFIGLHNTGNAIITNASQIAAGTTTAKVGMAHEGNTGNWSLVYNAQGSAPTVVDLGSNYPVNATSLYELTLYSPSNGSSIGYMIRNITSGVPANETSGSLTTNIPASNLMMGFHAWTNNVGTAAAALLAVGQVYIETDF